jgi:hypothetical protein
MGQGIEYGNGNDGVLADGCSEYLFLCGGAIDVFEVDDIGVAEGISWRHCASRRHSAAHLLGMCD